MTRKKHPLYGRWKAMRWRCMSPRCPDYPNYGGRGIRLCDRWMEFWNFVEDMGQSFSPGMTIERVDVNGDYEPGNCIWISNEEQANNRRSTNWIELDGIRMNVMQWSVYAGVDRSNIYRRMAKPGLTTRQIIYGVR